MVNYNRGDFGCCDQMGRKNVHLSGDFGATYGNTDAPAAAGTDDAVYMTSVPAAAPTSYGIILGLVALYLVYKLYKKA